MGNNLIRLWVCKDLKESLEDLRKSIAFDIKKRYNLSEVTIPTTLSSQVLAAKMQGKQFLDFKVRKNGLNRGTLELI